MKKQKRKYDPNKSKEFIALQNEWYAKLKDSGFNDLEVVSRKTGQTDHSLMFGTETHLKRRIRQRGTESTLYFYSLLLNFITHNETWSDIEHERFIAQQFAEGVSYRKIVKLWKEAHPGTKGFSIFIVFQTVKKFVAMAKEWNSTNENGLVYQSKLDELEELDGGES